jgi:hypothetical protein
MGFSYERVDVAERDRYRLSLLSDRDDLKHARVTLEYAIRDIAILVEEGDPTELQIAADQLSDAAARVRRLAIVMNHVESELRELGEGFQ